MTCPVVTRFLCQGLQNYYIQHHFNRYVKTLQNKTYISALNMSKMDAEKEICYLWNKRIELDKFDKIENGKRIKNLHHCIRIPL